MVEKFIQMQLATFLISIVNFTILCFLHMKNRHISWIYPAIFDFFTQSFNLATSMFSK